MASTKTSKPDSSATRVLPPAAFDKLYWLRIGLGALAGVATEGTQLLYGGFDWSIGVSIGIGVYLVSYYAAWFTWYRGLPKEQQGKIYTTGIGGFAMVFLFTWMLFFTLQSVG
ncbi:MAG: hypothetical protein KGI38_04125 [Thaumarchaeota archaeon]|nr:hypothetical protein [Nitrososphaerota archaeon]